MKGRQVRITYSSDVLGTGIFWTGSERDVESVRNIPARILAIKAFKTGYPQKLGMWQADIIESEG